MAKSGFGNNLVRDYSGRDRDEVIIELVKEQNELQDMMIDMLKVISDTHPEIALKYVGYADKIKSGRR